MLGQASLVTTLHIIVQEGEDSDPTEREQRKLHDGDPPRLCPVHLSSAGPDLYPFAIVKLSSELF